MIEIRPICGYYRKGKCRHGADGKKQIDGKECTHLHPRKCLKYCRYGSDRYQGCTGSCGLFHPILCKNSTRLKECFLPDCTLAHLSGTQRKREKTPTSNQETRYFYNHNIQDSRDFSNAYSSNRIFNQAFFLNV